MAALTLHRLSISPEAVEAEEGAHVFTFVLDPIPRPSDPAMMTSRGVESNEVTYGGQAWSLVGTITRDQECMGLFLKWRYADGATRSNVSVKVKYSMTLINRLDYNYNQTFRTTQKFTSSQTLLGKSRFIPLADLCSQSAGFLDSTGQGAIIELTMYSCRTCFEKLENIGASARAHRNAGGVYFDTSQFLLAGQKWYLRFYTSKLNSNGLPAVYLYLASKPRSVTLTLQFKLSLGEQHTEILTYGFGEGAKFDGFGKTLAEPLENVNKLLEIWVRMEVSAIIIHSTATVKFRQRTSTTGTPRGQSTPNWAYRERVNLFSPSSTAFASTTTTDPVLDLEGNLWKIDLNKNEVNNQQLSLTFDKGVHHFSNSKTRMLCWSAMLLSRDQEGSEDMEMSGGPVMSYFSNLLNDSPQGYLFSFPISTTRLEDLNSPFLDDKGEIFIRINFISLQTTPLVLRSSPKFEYQSVHLQQTRYDVTSSSGGRLELTQSERSLSDMKDMSASRASLSLILPSASNSSSEDLSSISDTATNNNKNHHTSESGSPFYKSTPSLVEDSPRVEQTVHTNGHNNSDSGSNFISTLLQHLALTSSSSSSSSSTSAINESINAGRLKNQNGGSQSAKYGCHNTVIKSISAGSQESSRIFGNKLIDKFRHTSTDGSVVMSTTDAAMLISEARVSSVECNQKIEAVRKIVKILQSLPINITEVVEDGSLFTGVTCRNGADALLSILSPDIPQIGQSNWMEVMLKSIQSHLEKNLNANQQEATPICSNYVITWRSLMFSCCDVRFEIRLSYDWSQQSRISSSSGRGSSSGSSYDSLFAACCENSHLTDRDRYWYSVASSKLQKSFVSDQPNEVKDVIKVVHQWSNCVTWSHSSYQPNSYLISLLVIKAAQELNTSDLFQVLQKLASLILSPELCISFNKFYDPDKYPATFDPPTPLVRDPANPVYNVASTLTYWEQFRMEYLTWMRQLNINVTLL